MYQKFPQNRSERIVVAVVGICGAIGSTLALGIARARSGKLPGFGMVTENAEFKELLPDLPPVEDWMLTGWDVTEETLLQSARRHQCCERHLVELEKKRLAKMKVRRALMPEPGWEKRFCEESDALLHLKAESGAEQIIIVNLAPTEPAETQEVDVDIDWENLKIPDDALPKLSISRLYLRLAIEVGAGFVNFTPNLAETPALLELAERRGILYCGRDGKTGETYLKTVLAPAFRNKNLKVNGWFSLNILGNADGFNLQSSSAGDTKIKSKRSSLESILGYAPGEPEESEYSHQVHIHYYPPRGDSKESWNNIDFSGFLGEAMQLKFNWLGKDSSLAVASVLDLVRFLVLARRAGETGLLEPLGYFFKLPLTKGRRLPEHASDRQYQVLLDFVRGMGLPEHLGGLLRHLADYRRSRRDCLSMHASENRMTQGTALLLAGDLANRYALKDPGNTHPGDIIFGNSHPISQVIVFCEKRFGSLIGAEYVNLTPLSGYVAADCLLYAFCDPGQTVFLVDRVHGGHPEMIPLARQFGLKVRFIPFDGMEPNMRELQEMVNDAKPALVYFNQSDALVLDGLNGLPLTPPETVVAFDASHVLGLIAGKLVTSPLDAGYDCLVGSTHKTFPGPHKGFFATRSQNLQDRFTTRTKNKISSSHPHHAVALASACEEYEVYGAEYARRLVQNAEALAQAFENEGLGVIRAEGIRTIETNQVWLRAADKTQAVRWFRRLEDGGIFTNYRELAFDNGWGLRIGLQEATLNGAEAQDVAQLGRIMADRLRNRLTGKETRSCLRLLLSDLTALYETPPETLGSIRSLIGV